MNDLRTAAQQALEALEFSTLDAFMLAPISPGRESTIKAITVLRAALAEPQITHSEDCYKWHHECAIARIEELKLLCEEMLSELYVYRASKHLKDVTAAIRARGEK